MPAWLWITSAAAVAFVLLVAFSRTGRVWWGGAVLWRVRWVLDWLAVLDARRWWYSWQRAAHVIEEAQAEPYRGPRPPAYCVPGCPDDVCRALGECAWAKDGRPLDFYGSMDREAERELHHDPHAIMSEFFAATPIPGPDWREQTAADLAPEALALGTCDWPGCDKPAVPPPDVWALLAMLAEGSRPDDPGPGDLPSLDPGPDLCAGCMCESHCDGAEDDCVCTCTFPADWAEPDDDDWEPITPIELAPSRLADTADVMDAHLLADVEAYMRAQDDDARAYGSARALGWAGFMRDLEAALA